METRQCSFFNDDLLKGKLEALLFAAGEAVTYRDLMRATESNEERLMTALDGLSENYQKQNRGIQLIRMEKSCQLATKTIFYPQIKALLGLHQRTPLSKAAMETLAIIAYRQPITRLEIERVRGVSSSRSIQSLLDKGLISEAGRKDAPGRPFLYKTTDDFLKAVDLRTLSELPAFDTFAADLEKTDSSEFELLE